jgi:hypothetical protein
MSVFDNLAKALKDFKPVKPTTPDPVGYHDFITAEYMKRVQQDAETSQWILQHKQTP